MNQILQKQNEPQFLKYLAAQRHLYDEEKRWANLWIIVVTLIAILGSGVFAFAVPVNAYLSLAAFLILFGELLIDYLISKRGEQAAGVQELFDTELLELPWNEFLVTRPETEVIESAARRFHRRARPGDADRLKDWYSRKAGGLPLHQARIECQRENLLWDQRQRKEYIKWVAAAFVIVILALVVIGIFADWTFREFFTGPLPLVLPFLWIGAKHLYGHGKAIQRLEELNRFADDLWESAGQRDADSEALTLRSRQLQDQIYQHRKENPPVYTWFYNRIRERYEKIMQT